MDWGDGFMDAQNQGYGNDDEEDDHFSDKLEADKYSRKAGDLCNQHKYGDALQYINLALDMNVLNAGNWNIKAIILDFMGRYSEAEKCYNTSLGLSPHKVVCDNKARMLRYWAGKLIEEAKKKPDGLPTLYDAWDINKRAMMRFREIKAKKTLKIISVKGIRLIFTLIMKRNIKKTSKALKAMTNLSFSLLPECIFTKTA